MNHEDIKKLISQEYDGEASPVVIDLIEKHVLKCEDCFKYRESLNKMSTVLESWGDEQLSPDAETKIRKMLQDEASDEEEIKMKPKNRLVRFGFGGGGVVVALLVLMVSLQVYTKRGIQGRLKSATDDIGSQFSPGNTNVVKAFSVGQNTQYEPYYLETNYGVDRKGNEVQKLKTAEVTAKVDSLRTRDAGGFQVSSYDPNFSGIQHGLGGTAKSTGTFSSGVSRSAVLPETTKTEVMNSQVVNQEYEYWGGGDSGVAENVQPQRKYRITKSAPQSGTRFERTIRTVEEQEGYWVGDELDPRTNMPYISEVKSGYYRDDVVNYDPYEVDRQRRIYYEPNTEEYQHIYENHFLQALQNPLSTFSIDVDTASYSNVRRFLNNNQLPPANAVRIEEMVNYFSYDYPEPMWNQPFSITTNASRAPWNSNHYLVQIGIQGKTLKQKQVPPSNLVFLVDVSGSMNQANKLPLLQKSLSMMVDQLGPNERVAIVTYAGSAGVALNSTPGSNKYAILSAINNLRAGGSTAGAQGIRLAYRIARQNFIHKGNNRVILATDGDFNVGVSSDHELVQLIEQERNSGIFLSVLGFGTGNYKDSKMKQIANKGNGNYFYIDNLSEGEKVLVHELGSTLFTIAKDVKIQVEFNPQQVSYYKLIGYEDRMLRKEDFNNDAIDAGELGAGHTVTALYEIVPTTHGRIAHDPEVDPLKYQGVTNIFVNKDIMTVKLRYKEPDGYKSKLIKKVLKERHISKYPKGDLKFAAAVAEFGLLLRNSPTKGYASYDRVLLNARNSIGKDDNGYRQQFLSMVEKAQRLDHRPQYIYPTPFEEEYPAEYYGHEESNIQFK